MTEVEVKQPVAVSAEETKKHGCPYCGYRSGLSLILSGGTVVVACGECDGSFAVLAEGITRSKIGFGDYYPELQPHPRKGTPAHGTPDKQPDGGGEFFWSRGIGLDSCICFVCGSRDRDGEGPRMRNNIAAFVQCKASGERVVAMVEQGAWLDFRAHAPDRVQVKIGACDTHLPNLRQLNRLCSEGTIKPEMVAIARS